VYLSEGKERDTHGGVSDSSVRPRKGGEYIELINQCNAGKGAAETQGRRLKGKIAILGNNLFTWNTKGMEKLISREREGLKCTQFLGKEYSLAHFPEDASDARKK